MRGFFLFFKTALRTPAVIVGAAILLLVSAVSFGYVSARQTLPCAVCTEDDSAEAQAVLAALEEYDFLFFDTLSEVEEAVKNGTADCGAVLKAGLGQSMETGDMENVCEFILSSRTGLKSTYSLLISSAILDVYISDLTIQAFAARGYTLSEEEVQAYLAEAGENISLLEFTMTDTEGGAVDASPTDTLPVGMIAIAAFVVFGFLSVAAVRKNAGTVQQMLPGRRAYLGAVLLPRVSGISVLLTAAMLLGIAAGRLILTFSLPQLLAAAVGYMALLTFLFALLLLLPVRDHVLILLIAALGTVSLVLCPLHVNIVLYLPAAKILRLFAPPYWLYILEDFPAAAVLAAAGVLLAVVRIIFSANQKALRA